MLKKKIEANRKEFHKQLVSPAKKRPNSANIDRILI